MRVPRRRAVERQHLHIASHIGRLRTETVEEIPLGPPEISAPDQAVTLRAVGRVRQRAGEVPVVEIHQILSGNGHRPDHRPAFLRHREADPLPLLHGDFQCSHGVCRALHDGLAAVADKDLEPPHGEMRVRIELIGDFKHAVRGRGLPAPHVGSGLFKFARQDPATNSLPGVVVREARDLAGPHTDVPQARETIIGAGEGTTARLGREDLGVFDLN